MLGMTLIAIGKKESRSERRTMARPYSDFCDYCSLLFDCAECKRSKMTHFSHDYEQGIKDERERIIKLLEDNNKLCTEKTVCLDADDGWLCNCEELIALIKGEQK